MPSTLPDGDPAPRDGSLPESALAGVAGTPLLAYLHVPFCAVRCGYCDFNTYTANELGPGGSIERYLTAARAEIDLLAGVLGPVAPPPLTSVFVGGGTPTLLPADGLAGLLTALQAGFGLAPDVEVTVEANPDSVTPESLAALVAAGYNRISFGVQSSVRSVLAVLDRTHDPERVPQVVEWARQAGFAQVSLDLIYGTPGESLEQWRASLENAIALRPDHLSAYALIVEDGTALARQVRRGDLAAPDDDDLADKYLLAEELLTAAGLGWYEVSNWSTGRATRCRHNEGYWRSENWLGIGPGAHAHVGGVRWWNRKHPAAYADSLLAGESPAQARELLDEDTRALERILLEARLRDGLPLDLLDPERVAEVIAAGRAEQSGDRLVLTLTGRLLADAVVRTLVG